MKFLRSSPPYTLRRGEKSAEVIEQKEDMLFPLCR
jgi:hypothetical protein